MSAPIADSAENKDWRSDSTASDLLSAARGMDPEAWSKLVDRYSPLIFWWALRSGLKEHDAADVVQIVLTQTAAYLGKFKKDGKKAAFRRWLRAITTDKIARFRQAEAKQPHGEGGSDARNRLDQFPDELPPSGIQRPPVDMRRQRFWVLVDRLEEEFEESTWDAFWLTTIENCTSTEAGKQLGMTANAVRLAKGRVLQRLREDAACADVELPRGAG